MPSLKRLRASWIRRRFLVKRCETTIFQNPKPFIAKLLKFISSRKQLLAKTLYPHKGKAFVAKVEQRPSKKNKKNSRPENPHASKIIKFSYNRQWSRCSKGLRHTAVILNCPFPLSTNSLVPT